MKKHGVPENTPHAPVLAFSTPQPAKPAPAITDPCLQHLRKTSIGQSFVLLLRQEQDIKMHKPPVWSDTKRGVCAF